MEKNQQHVGLLQRYGLPAMSRNEYVTAAQRAREEEIVNAPNRDGRAPSSSEQGFSRIGIAISRKFFNKRGSEPELTDEQERKFEIVERAQDRFTQMREDSPDLWGSMSAEDKSLTYRRFLADAADEAGDAALATSLNDEYTAAYNSTIKQKLELKKAGIDVDDSLEEFQQRQFDNDTTRNHGTHVAGYPLNSSDPNSAVAGQRMRDGSFHYTDPKTGRKKVSRPGEWSPTRPQREPLARTGGGGSPAQPSVTRNKIGQMRDDVVNTSTQLRVGMEMYNLMADMAKEYGSIEFLSNAGSITSFTVRLIENISALTRTGSELSIPFLNSEGKVVGNIQALDERSLARYIDSPATRTTMGALESDFNESSHLRETFRSAEVWKANVVRLAYARARAREPGARQLSDNDIQQARAELAAMSTDPESFRRVMLGGLGGDIEKLEQSIGLVPENERPLLFGKEGMDTYYELRDQFKAAYDGEGFGTAKDPGPGLNPAAGQGRVGEVGEDPQFPTKRPLYNREGRIVAYE